MNTITVKNSRLLALLILTALLGLSILLEGCNNKCTESVAYTYYEPVYAPFATIGCGVTNTLT
ncbi:MAG: hypothetical protein KF725_07045 [Cyclobacteriaceae bacterium]|nr:hypothetical protein [Cyclobacteriaceae bacterium]UYN88319.1 MAG: hypothetical protein KIT51_08765 [Cyclobacteriaceae bacterium]